MSLGSDFTSGFSAVQDIKTRRAQRALEKEMQERKIAADVASLQAQFKGQGDLQSARLTVEGMEAEKTRGFAGSQKALDRTHGTSEREASQGFAGGQNAANRNVTLSEGSANRKQNSDQSAARLEMDAKSLAQSGQQFADQFSWKKDPTNPENIFKRNHADYLMRDSFPPALPNATDALKNSQKAQTYRVGQKIQQNGITYIWDGKEFAVAP